MHLRNVFCVGRDFDYLATKYAFFAPFVRQTKGSQKGTFTKTIDFKDTLALRALAQALLLDEYGLNVEFPIGTLVPRIPHRLEYILWLEDFINEYDFMMLDTKGIDIGTGASAIYALLGAKINKWKMLATESNQASSECAMENIKRNGLTDIIEVRKVAPGSIFADIDSLLKTSKYTFVMCNPPFFDATEFKIIGQRRNEKCPGPSGGPTGKKHELSTCGGEVQLVNKMIQESLEYSKNIILFTTMIGVARHLKPIKETFQKLGICNFLVKEKVCGKTRRWYVAWSFDERVVLQPDRAYILNRIESFPTVLHLENIILKFLSDINITCTRIKKTTFDCFHILAYESSWRQQRKRKRANLSASNLREGVASKMAKQQSSSALNEEPTSSARMWWEGSAKPHCEDSVVKGPILDSEDNKATRIPVLDAILTIIQTPFPKEPCTIYFNYRGGSRGKQGLQELNKYLMNCYAEKAKSLEESGFSLSLCMSPDTYRE